MKINLGSALLTALLLATPAAALLATPAAALAAQDITADHGAVWPVKKIGQSTQGFVQIHNTSGTADVLMAWNCTIADTTALVGADGKPLQSLVIPAGQTVTLAPDGPHLLLQTAHFPVAMGSIVPCAFTFQNAGAIAVYLNEVPTPAAN